MKKFEAGGGGGEISIEFEKFVFCRPVSNFQSSICGTPIGTLTKSTMTLPIDPDSDFGFGIFCFGFLCSITVEFKLNSYYKGS